MKASRREKAPMVLPTCEPYEFQCQAARQYMPTDAIVAGLSEANQLPVE